MVAHDLQAAEEERIIHERRYVTLRPEAVGMSAGLAG
jgi:hypothetical protein